MSAWSLLPPVVAIMLGLATGRVVAALLISVFTGAMILADRTSGPGDWFVEVVSKFFGELSASAAEPSHLQVLAFTLLLGAMVGVLVHNGSFADGIDRFAAKRMTRRRFQVTAWLMGLALFFDDYANSLLLGTTLRPAADRAKVSPAKLAYLVDSTAAPVAGLSLISTWVAAELSAIDQGLVAAGLTGMTALQVFVATLPYRFYPWLALILVGLVAISGRDLEPMRRAEAEVATSDQAAPADQHRRCGWWIAALALTLCLLGLLLTMYATGPMTELRPLYRMIGGDSYIALVVAGALGWIFSVMATLITRQFTLAQLVRPSLTGAARMLPAMLILWLAWTLATMTDSDHLATGQYLASKLTGHVPLWLIPTAIFVLAGFCSLCTGTSWGTIALLTPLVTPLVVSMTGSKDPVDPALLAALGAVLAGAIFGDHCSPLSDTTVLSSQATGCNHVEHVRTQMPYALLAGGCALVAGTLPLGFGFSVGTVLPVAVLVLAVSFFALSKHPPLPQ